MKPIWEWQREIRAREDAKRLDPERRLFSPGMVERWDFEDWQAELDADRERCELCGHAIIPGWDENWPDRCSWCGQVLPPREKP